MVAETFVSIGRSARVPNLVFLFNAVRRVGFLMIPTILPSSRSGLNRVKNESRLVESTTHRNPRFNEVRSGDSIRGVQGSARGLEPVKIAENTVELCYE